MMSDLPFQVLTVGEPYVRGKRHWPEAYEYNYRVGGHELRMFIRTPYPKEVEAVTAGDARFALVVLGDIIFLAFQFENALVGECPYSWHMVSPEDRVLPDLDFPPGVGAVLRVVLVDAETGLVRGLRVLAFNRRFSLKLHRAILAQSLRPFDQATYDQQLAEAYQRYDHCAIWNMAVARTRAGEK